MDTIPQTPVQTIPDDVWKIICDTVYKYDYLKMDDRAKRLVEKNTQITPFEGGAFIAVGNRFDLYVVPERQGKWNIRREVNKYLAEMAQKYGIDGFCYYHYWFNGKLLLERPTQEILKSKEPNFPFCFCWANESWSKRWLGEDEDVFVKQKYSEEDHIAHAKYLSNFFKDDRYIKVNNQPVFAIYRPSDIPNIEKTIEIFREICFKETGMDLFLIGSNSHEWDTNILLGYGFDAVLSFRPQLGVLPYSFTDQPVLKRLLRNIKNFGVINSRLRLYDYAEAIEIMKLVESESFDKIMPTVFLGWDNTARKGDSAIVISGNTPELFLKELYRVHQKLQKAKENNGIIFINAWNEWAEGCHLEPDMKNEYSYLEAIRKFKDSTNE
jgi:hypothetical protein